jgi:ferrous iron transport protein B
MGLQRLGIDTTKWDYLVALAGNPNTGKSTVFNALTGLRQHVGNWPGKTVSRAEGGFSFDSKRCKLVDLPGTYSLLSASTDEEIARDFILFGRPDCTVIVVDATILERNLNLVLQVLEITDRAVVCLNLMDEARRKGIQVDDRALAKELGVPVVPTTARTREGIPELIHVVNDIASGALRTLPRHVQPAGPVQRPLESIAGLLEKAYPGMPNARWVAMRLLEGDASVTRALEEGDFGDLTVESGSPAAGGVSPQVASQDPAISPRQILDESNHLRSTLDLSLRDEIVKMIYDEARAIVSRVVHTPQTTSADLDTKIDRIVTSRLWGLPIMLLSLAVVFWITIAGANYPSRLIATGLFWIEDQAAAFFGSLGSPWWLTGFIWHGVYRGLAWVVAVMFPPMAIFFPLFTTLENLGFLPRVAFNLDWLFKRVGAHGKQALTMCMGVGCNAAGVVACRIIESPRERLIAILTNNFVPCNGRFPTLIMLGTVFVAASFPPGLASVVAAGSVVGVVLIGIVFTFIISWALSRTVLRGQASSFTLELPPYRRPNLGQILYTSLIDRTLFVLYRAVVMAAPAGGLIWLLSNISIGGESMALSVSTFLDPFGRTLGLLFLLISLRFRRTKSWCPLF